MLDCGAVDSARKRGGDQRLALLDAGGMDAGGLLGGGDVFLHLFNLLAHHRDLRFGRGRHAGDAADRDRADGRLGNAIGGEQHGDARDARQQRLGAAAVRAIVEQGNIRLAPGRFIIITAPLALVTAPA